MMRRITYPILAILMIFIVKLDCNAQNVNDLEKKVTKLQNEIQTSQKLLNQTSKKQADHYTGSGAFAGSDKEKR